MKEIIKKETKILGRNTPIQACSLIQTTDSA